MWIKSEYGLSRLFNTDNLSEINVAKSKIKNNYTILAQQIGIEKPVVIDEYELKSTAQSALDQLSDALIDGEYFFNIPRDGDPSLSYATGEIQRGASCRKPKTNGKTK